jgi:hypothetical protein
MTCTINFIQRVETAAAVPFDEINDYDFHMAFSQLFRVGVAVLPQLGSQNLRPNRQ